MNTLENKNKRVCIPISGSCDNRCVFCMDDWTLSKLIEPAELFEKLKAARKYGDEVTFSSLEPTLHPHIIEIARYAKSLDFQVIEIVTNGNRLEDLDFCQQLIDAGINTFSLSIHSHNDKIHDSMVGNEGAFAKAVKGLQNLVSLKNTHPISLAIGIVVCQWNYRHIYEAVKFFEYFGVDDIVLNILQMKNSAVSNAGQIGVQYSLLVPEITKLMPLQNQFGNIRINGLVPCISEQIMEYVGYFNGAWVMPDEKGEYSVTLQSGKSKRAECSSCKYYNSCEGVWDSYTTYFSWNEFNPIR